MAAKVDLEVLGVIENMSGFTTPDGQRFTIFGEGGGQQLADELDVPLLGKVPLLGGAARARRRRRRPLVLADPEPPPARRSASPARGIVAATPQELPVMQAPAAGDAAAPAAGRRHRAAGRPGRRLALTRAGGCGRATCCEVLGVDLRVLAPIPRAAGPRRSRHRPGRPRRRRRSRCTRRDRCRAAWAS